MNEDTRARRSTVLALAVRSLGMRRNWISHEIPEPTAEDLERIRNLLGRIGGQNVVWGARELLEIWAAEQRAKFDQQMSKRISTASWVLVAATIGLVICTAGLIWATRASGSCL